MEAERDTAAATVAHAESDVNRYAALSPRRSAL